MQRASAFAATGCLVLLLAALPRGDSSTARAQASPESSATATPAPDSSGAGAQPQQPAGAQPAGSPTAGTPGARPSPLAMRVFTLRFRKIDDAYALISPYVGSRGSVKMQPVQKTLTVQDAVDNLQRIASLISSYDVPPHNVEVSVQLIMATAGSRAQEPAPPIRGVIDKLSALNTRWSDYRMIGNARVQGTEGEPSSVRLGDDYKVEFRIDQVSDETRIIRFKPFELSRREPLADGAERYTSIVNTVLNLRDAQQFIVGASKIERSNRALFMTITAATKRP